MVSGTVVACVAIDIALCLINEKNRRWVKEWYKRRPQYIHENLMTAAMLCEPNYFTKSFVRFDGPAFDGILKTYLSGC
jgi:hypothetical protein